LPVIALKGTVSEELFPEGGHVFLDSADPHSLAEAVVGLLSDRPRAIAIGDAGARRVREVFTTRHFAERLREAISPLEARRVAIRVEHYLPGFRSGGPLRSISALVEQLGDQIDFYVIARDRDAGTDRPYPDVEADTWRPVGKARVRYLTPEQIAFHDVIGAVRDVEPHAIYLNSLFSPLSVRILLARRFGSLNAIPVLLAPRGELSPGALRLKRLKKRCYLQLAFLTRLHADVVF